MVIQNFTKVQGATGAYATSKIITYEEILELQEKGYLPKNAKINETLFPLEMNIQIETQFPEQGNYAIDFDSEKQLPEEMKNEVVLNRTLIHYSQYITANTGCFGFEFEFPSSSFDKKTGILTF